MPHFELIDCRIKIQVCVGHFPDGRMRTRTFGIKGVRPDVNADDVAATARAIGALLAHPIVAVRLVRKYLLVRQAPVPIVLRRSSATCARCHNCHTASRKSNKLLQYWIAISARTHRNSLEVSGT